MKKEEIKILLVDDEPDIIEIIRFNLNSEGYQIFTANDGLEAIKLAEKQIKNSNPGWEDKLPDGVSDMIIKKKMFGYK